MSKGTHYPRGMGLAVRAWVRLVVLTGPARSELYVVCVQLAWDARKEEEEEEEERGWWGGLVLWLTHKIY